MTPWFCPLCLAWGKFPRPQREHSLSAYVVPGTVNCFFLCYLAYPSHPPRSQVAPLPGTCFTLTVSPEAQAPVCEERSPSLTQCWGLNEIPGQNPRQGCPLLASLVSLIPWRTLRVQPHWL